MTNHTQATFEEVARIIRDKIEINIDFESTDIEINAVPAAVAILALPSVCCPADDPAGVVYQRLLWRHLEAARKDSHGANSHRIFKLIDAFREEFPAECAAYEAQFPAPPQAGEDE